MRGRSQRTMLTALLGILTALATACSGVTGPEREIEGNVLYDQYCARCHGVSGEPVPGVDPPCDSDPSLPGCAPSFRDRARMDQLSDEAFKGAIMSGKPAPTRRGAAPGKGMPAFPTQFTEATLMVLIAYVRGLSGSQGPHAPVADAPEE